MRVFVRKMSSKVDIQHVTVIGGGLMGSGIAQVSDNIYFKSTSIQKTNVNITYFQVNDIPTYTYNCMFEL